MLQQPSELALKSTIMLISTRNRALWRLSRGVRIPRLRSYAFSANDNKEINDPTPSKEVPNVSKTNELPMETHQRDEALQENVEDAEKRRVTQAPNRRGVWSRAQNPREKAMTGPRFEQTIMELQVRSPSQKILIPAFDLQ